MKANRFAKLMVLVCAMLFAAGTVHAFYNPSTGRWLSRDPMEERGGLNLHGFVNNAPPVMVDHLGQKPLADNKTRTIIVGKCEIAIIYGHGATARNKRNWKWRVTRSGCAAGTAVMCWPTDNTENLDEGLNLWTQWGGEPIEFGWHTVMWGMSPRGSDWYQGLGRMPNANKVLVTVAKDAINRAITICKNNKCGCKNIGVYFIQVDHDGRPMDPKKAYDGVPLVADLTVPCSGSPPPPPTCE